MQLNDAKKQMAFQRAESQPTKFSSKGLKVAPRNSVPAARAYARATPAAR